jgi:hypothetical protein
MSFSTLRYTSFLVVGHGGISISSARGRLRPEVTSPVDGAALVSCSCSSDIFCYVVPFRRCDAFRLAKNGGMTTLAAMGRARPEMTSSFDSLTPICYRLPLESFVYLSPFKRYLTFSISTENAL